MHSARAIRTICGRPSRKPSDDLDLPIKSRGRIFLPLPRSGHDLSYKEAAEILKVDYSAIANRAEKFRTWLLELDPSGGWEARARLDLKPRPLVPCPICSKDTHVRFLRFHEDRRTRRLVCRACLVTWALSTTQGKEGLPLQTTVAYDPRVSRLRRDRERR
jgi:hypothetical protein